MSLLLLRLKYITLWLIRNPYIIFAAAGVIFLWWYGHKEYKRGYSDAVAAHDAAERIAQKQNNTIWRDVHRETAKIPDTGLDAAGAALGILRPDDAR